MDWQELAARLRKVQEPQGYYLSSDSALVEEILRGLLINKDRYGYLSCPCRLALGSREKDRDILCPCDYRQADVAEFGACFCGLYVSKELKERGDPTPVVPERRPPELSGF